MYNSERKNDNIINKSIDLIKAYPLCDRCLGRMFARLGLGWSNSERGKAIKFLVIMHLHEMLRRGVINKDYIKDVMINIGPISYQLYKNLYNEEPNYKRCYLCNSIIEDFIDKASLQVSYRIDKYNVKKFLIGIRINDDTIIKEESIKSQYKLSYGESIKNELKREIGKKVQQIKPNSKVDFDSPEVVYEISFPDLNIRDQKTSLILFGKYKKAIRGISIIGPTNYNSILNDLAKIFDSNEIILHLINRDEPDFRTLGKGASIIAEIKKGKLIELDNKLIEGHNSLISIENLELKRGQLSNLLTNKKQNRIYRVLILCENDINDELINLVNKRNLMIEQIINRKKINGLMREIACYKVFDNIMECLISIDDPLYIKEIVNGNKTTPSISSIIGSNCNIIEGDLLSFE
jgi:tRNA pseudouridine synthase 10